jgi:resuscitation-promoting factor RpfB
MSRTDHPPSTYGPPRHLRENPRKAARRALWSSVAAVAVVVGPVTIASATDGPNVAAAAEPSASITLQKEAQLIRSQSDGSPILATVETVAEAVAPPTTAAPAPTTTTTAPPPPPPAPAVQPAASGSGYADPNNPAAWDRLAQCESGGNWAADTGNGYYGGIQFSLSSWRAVGGAGYPNDASRETQIAMGQRLWNQGGWSHWPACSSQLGYR